MSNSLIKKNITFIITTFKSRNTIFECLDSLEPECKKIIIENSNDINLMKEIQDRYQNLSYQIMPNNYGYGKANNFGIQISVTDYIFILNPDTKFDKISFNRFIGILNNKDFSIAAPTEINEIEKINFEKNDLMNVNIVKGFAMLLRKSDFKNFFDENIFLYLEEIDLCLNAKKNKNKIYLVNVPIVHIGGASHGNKEDFEMEKSRNWHWMWSTFYFNRKHYGYVYSFLITFPKFISSFLKFILYKITNNHNKKFYYKMRFLGLLNSYLLKKSTYRPYINKN